VRLGRDHQRVIGGDIMSSEIAWSLCCSVVPRRDLWEIQSRLSGKQTARLLVTLHGDRLVLLHGLVRKEELSDRDLDLAVRRQQEVVNGGHKRHFGSFFDRHLEKAGTFEEATLIAWKRVLALEVTEAMRKQGITKSEMAKRMATSRSQLDRFLDPDNLSVLLETLHKAALVLGKRLSINLIDEPRR
jgi:antitoxin HicB